MERLPGTADEAAAIKPSVTRYAGTEALVYQDQYALEGVFKAMHRPQVLVLSTHGFFLPDQEVAHKDERTAALTDDRGTMPRRIDHGGQTAGESTLAMRAVVGRFNQRPAEEASAGVDDGILTGLEIVGTDLRGTELVVLSACDTGLGQIRNGEGVAGLRQAFQLAGAKAVVSTLWQIPDRETVDLTTAFFANLSAGQSKADALRMPSLRRSKPAAQATPPRIGTIGPRLP